MTKEIEADLYRYGGLKGMTGFFKGLRKPGFRYVYILRKLSDCKKYSPKWIVFSFLKRRYTFKYGFQIPTNTKIGKGLYIAGSWIYSKGHIMADYYMKYPVVFNFLITTAQSYRDQICKSMGQSFKRWNYAAAVGDPTAKGIEHRAGAKGCDKRVNLGKFNEQAVD